MNLFKVFSIGCLILICSHVHGENAVFTITDFGAKGDGFTINTVFITKAVQICYANGGGTVIVHVGVFISGTIVLLSKTQLQLATEAILTGSKDTTDYLQM